ncbi:MAG TPA: IS110 family transposase [Pyrinomonadaceae bacterium]|jgi:transposase
MRKHYVGMDVHQASTTLAVINEQGKLTSESLVETKAQTIIDFLKGLRGEVHVTFEEGTQAAWLYDIIRPHVTKLVVCNPHHNHLLKSGNKSDRADARKLAQLLRVGMLRPVYHGEQGMRTLKELVRSYECLVADTSRVKNRIKAIYRGRGVRPSGRAVYQASQRELWLRQIESAGLRTRAELLYRQLDQLQLLRREAKRAMLKESRQQAVTKLLQQIPELGPVRIAQIIATVGTPHRFRTKRQFWSYIGLAVVTRSSDDYRLVNNRMQKRRLAAQNRGLNRNYNHRLKSVFKAAALGAAHSDAYREYYERLVTAGIRAELARLTLARKLAATVLAVWKSSESFTVEKVMLQAA